MSVLKNFLYALISLIVGCLFFLLDGQTISDFIFIVLGILIILFNLDEFISCIKNLKYKTSAVYTQFILSCAIIILGLITIFLKEKIATIFGAIILLLIVINLIINYQHFKEIFFEFLPLIVIDLVLLILGVGGIINVLCTIVGVVLIINSVVILIATILNFRGKNND